ncbi:MAG: beta galactosidase jelly roll domain-containing protein, partial [Planctomycetes bacterium]|nr:beta galactosidase jelly roll domain-containing protein [Planctomycetota bacterium]
MIRPQQSKTRDLLNLSGFWDYARAKGNGKERGFYKSFPSEGKLGVPGSYNEQVMELYHHFDEIWYQTAFYTAPSWAGRKVFMQFESVCQNAEVWINGTHLGEHIGPHLPFEFEITDFLRKDGENTLTVLANGRVEKDSLPPARMDSNDMREGWSPTYPAVAYDFFPFSGIHRPVYIYSVSEENHIKSLMVNASHNDGIATVNAKVEIDKPMDGEVLFEIEGLQFRAEFSGDNTTEIDFEIQDPRIWDIGQGELYTLNATLIKKETTLDHAKCRFGIRNISIEGNSFLLNGKPVIFKGFGKHEDFDIIGKGLSHPLVIKDYDLMKWIGANSYRTSHYPYAEEWLDMADELGVMVISENPFVGLNNRLYNDDILKKALLVVEEHISRDYNHPSVVMWSLANEPNSGGSMDTEDKYQSCMNFFKFIIEKTKSIDANRPICYAAHANPKDNQMAHLFDVLLLNKYYGWYKYTGLLDASTD